MGCGWVGVGHGWQVSSLASVYHKPQQSFLVHADRQAVTLAATAAGNDIGGEDGHGTADASAASASSARAAASSDPLDVLDLIGGGGGGGGGGASAQKPAVVDDLLDLLGDIGAGAAPPPAQAPVGGGAGGGMMDLLGGMSLDGGGGGGAGRGAAGGVGKPLKALLTGDKGGPLVHLFLSLTCISLFLCHFKCMHDSRRFLQARVYRHLEMPMV